MNKYLEKIAELEKEAGLGSFFGRALGSIVGGTRTGITNIANAPRNFARNFSNSYRLATESPRIALPVGPKQQANLRTLIGRRNSYKVAPPNSLSRFAQKEAPAPAAATSTANAGTPITKAPSMGKGTRDLGFTDNAKRFAIKHPYVTGGGLIGAGAIGGSLLSSRSSDNLEQR